MFSEIQRAIQLPRQEIGMTAKECDALIEEYKDGFRQVTDA
jgi:hypothetical protein